MNAIAVHHLMSGALLFGYLSAAAFFFRFWTRTRDRLFVLFGSAFAILAAQRLLLAISHETTEDLTYLYVLRLLAFVVILFAIIDKNRSTAGDDQAGGVHATLTRTSE